MNRLDKHIRCNCGKEYGVLKFRQNAKCKRCKTEVVARGLKNEQQK
jgi:uncharacterized paraquat-inducible protein A